VLYALLIGGAIVMMLPMVFMITTALMPDSMALPSPPLLFPTHPTFSNFAYAWTQNDFGRYFMNSVIVAVPSTAICIFFSSMLAFAFARYKFPGRTMLFYGMLGTLMIPGLVLIIPQYVLAHSLGLLNSLQGLIVIYSAGMALNVFLLKGFFEDVPRDLADAAAIDGAGIWRLFWSIMMPLARPFLATVTIFTFLANWQEFTFAFTFINDSSNFTLPVALESYIGVNTTYWGIFFAASLIATIPVVIVFLIFQRHFIKGLGAAAVKG